MPTILIIEDEPVLRSSMVRGLLRDSAAQVVGAATVAEARALHAAKVDHAWVSATKASHGHTLGAAGGVEAVATVLALHRGLLPPTRNLTHPDGAVHLRHVTVPYSVQVDVAISNSFGFGGHNACLVFTRHGA